MISPEWTVHEIDPDVAVVIDREMPVLDPALDARVELLWRAELGERPALFNGRVFCADTITPRRVGGHWTEFRRVVAQMRDGAMFDVLHVRSLAVNGVLICKDGIVFGRRDRRAVYQAGMWQLPPAGSVDLSAAGPAGSVLLDRQVLGELREEVGLSAVTVRCIRPLCLIEHPGSHVLDLGMAIEVVVDGAALLAAHAAHGNREYEEIQIVPRDRLWAVMTAMADQLVPPAQVFVQRAVGGSAATNQESTQQP